VAPKRCLVRLAADGDRIRVDRGARFPGRGAYVCPGSSCLQDAERHGRLSRALRRPAQLPRETLESGV